MHSLTAIGRDTVSVHVSFSHARDHLAQIWEDAEETREMAVISRRGHEDMVLMPASELSDLLETVYLVRSPANAARLAAALTRGRQGGTAATDLNDLRVELGLDNEIC